MEHGQPCPRELVLRLADKAVRAPFLRSRDAVGRSRANFRHAFDVGLLNLKQFEVFFADQFTKQVLPFFRQFRQRGLPFFAGQTGIVFNRDALLLRRFLNLIKRKRRAGIESAGLRDRHRVLVRRVLGTDEFLVAFGTQRLLIDSRDLVGERIGNRRVLGRGLKLDLLLQRIAQTEEFAKLLRGRFETPKFSAFSESSSLSTEAGGSRLVRLVS